MSDDKPKSILERTTDAIEDAYEDAVKKAFSNELIENDFLGKFDSALVKLLERRASALAVAAKRIQEGHANVG